MDAPALTPDQVRELAALRRRAYGRDPDIDAADAARMAVLESIARGIPPSDRAPLVPKPDPTDVERTESAELPASGPPVLPVEVRTDDAGEGGAAARALGWGRAKRRAVVFGAAVLALVVLLWGVAQGVGPHPDRTLRPLVSDGGEQPSLGVVEAQALRAFGVDTDDVREYDGYESFRVWAAYAANGQRCLAIYAGSYGPAVSCTPRGLDSTVDVVIYDGMSPTIQRGLPQGSVIRWVLSGDDVLVWERVLAADS